MRKPKRPHRRPRCQPCKQNGNDVVAEYLAAASYNRGKKITWRRICADCAYFWNEGGDWEAPVYKIDLSTTHYPMDWERVFEGRAYQPTTNVAELLGTAARALTSAETFCEVDAIDDPITSIWSGVGDAAGGLVDALDV